MLRKYARDDDVIDIVSFVIFALMKSSFHQISNYSKLQIQSKSM